MTLYARLSNRDDRRVVCGMLGCGARLAEITVLRFGGNRLVRLLLFEPDWAVGRDDRVWYRMRRERSRRRSSYVPANMWGARLVLVLPVEARCPACGSRQTLDAERLRVDVVDAATYVELKNMFEWDMPDCPGPWAPGRRCPLCAWQSAQKPWLGIIFEWRYALQLGRLGYLALQRRVR